MLEKEGICVKLIKFKSRWDIAGIFKLASLMRAERIKIVHTHMYASSIAGMAAARLAGIPGKVVNMHSLHEWHSRRRILIAAKLFGYADKIITVSNAIGCDLARRLRLPPDKIITIHNGVDLARFEPKSAVCIGKETLGIKKNELVIGAVGRLVAFKGFKYLLRAFHTVSARRSDTKLVIVGGGELKDKLMQEAQLLGIADKVIFAGRQEDVIPYLSSFDLMVMPSITEGLPNALLEAMAMGKPVVASNVGGIPEVIEDKVSGFLAPSKDSQELALAVETLLADKELRLNVGQAGRRRVEKFFSIERVYKQTVSLYKELLSRVSF